MREINKLAILVGAFIAAYMVPWEDPRIRQSGLEAFLMLQEYAREHVLTCLIPAFFIAGAIAVFVRQASILKYFGPDANKFLSYSVASVSGGILAVCSCTVLPLFAGIYMRGAGIGPATAFLYSGPAINVLAIVMTAKILGWKLGLARAIGAILFAALTGLLMALFFERRGKDKNLGPIYMPESGTNERTLLQESLFILNLVLILIFATWARPQDPNNLIWNTIFSLKWFITVLLLVSLGIILFRWFERRELKTWLDASWNFMKQIFPLLGAGVLIAGFMLGRPGHQGLIPGHHIQALLGGNGLGATLFASVAGALMYFATLTEVPILQGLLGSGMGSGPALALLLAGPALSLPNMIVIAKVMGIKKAIAFFVIIITMSTLAGLIYGRLNP